MKFRHSVGELQTFKGKMSKFNVELIFVYRIVDTVILRWKLMMAVGC